jgi:hypothetical protein
MKHQMEREIQANTQEGFHQNGKEAQALGNLNNLTIAYHSHTVLVQLHQEKRCRVE